MIEDIINESKELQQWPSKNRIYNKSITSNKELPIITFIMLLQIKRTQYHQITMHRPIMQRNVSDTKMMFGSCNKIPLCNMKLNKPKTYSV